MVTGSRDKHEWVILVRFKWPQGRSSRSQSYQLSYGPHKNLGSAAAIPHCADNSGLKAFRTIHVVRETGFGKHTVLGILGWRMVN